MGIKEHERFKMEYTPCSILEFEHQVGTAVTGTLTSCDDTSSLHSHSDNAPDKTTMTSILSQMASTKTSWVENQKLVQDLPTRTSPMLCKGTPLGNPSLTPHTANKMVPDKGMKYVRDGRKFDLLPISKYLAHYQQKRQLMMKTTSPLVRISSYHPIRNCACTEGEKHCNNHPHKEPSDMKQTTFFSTIGIFKSFRERLLPTKGELLYVEPMNKSISMCNMYKVKLPKLQKNQNSTFVTQTSSRLQTRFDTRFAFPAIAS